MAPDRLTALRAGWARLTALTPGQQWTAALAVLLTTAVMLYGSPVRRVTGVLPSGSAASSGPANGGGEAALTGGGDATRPVRETVRLDVVGTGAGSRPSRAVAPSPAPTPVPPAGDDSGGGTAAEEFEPPAVVAVVSTDGSEAAVARAHLRDADFEWTVVEVDAEVNADSGSASGSGSERPASAVAAACSDIAAAGDLVVAAHGLGPALTDCLTDRDLVVVAHDDGGNRTGASGQGAVVSTRRSLRESLVDLAVGLSGRDELAGAVGVVGDPATREQVEAAVPGMRFAGLDVVATAFPEDDGDATLAVLDFVGRGVTAVVFATSTDRQSAWAARHSLLEPGVQYVVADAADSVVEEGYEAPFASALAHTAQRVPWFARTHGPTATQRACDEVHEPAGGASPAERVESYLWCQHVALVRAGIKAAPEGNARLVGALRGVRLPSPVTSDLAPLPGGVFGPAEDAVLRWWEECGCWTEERPFRLRARTGSRGGS